MKNTTIHFNMYVKNNQPAELIQDWAYTVCCTAVIGVPSSKSMELQQWILLLQGACCRMQFLFYNCGYTVDCIWKNHSSLVSTGVKPVIFSEWEKIDSVETSKGEAMGKPREKLLTVQEMLQAAHKWSWGSSYRWIRPNSSLCCVVWPISDTDTEMASQNSVTKDCILLKLGYFVCYCNTWCPLYFYLPFPNQELSPLK